MFDARLETMWHEPYKCARSLGRIMEKEHRQTSTGGLVSIRGFVFYLFIYLWVRSLSPSPPKSKHARSSVNSMCKTPRLYPVMQYSSMSANNGARHGRKTRQQPSRLPFIVLVVLVVSLARSLAVLNRSRQRPSWPGWFGPGLPDASSLAVRAPTWATCCHVLLCRGVVDVSVPGRRALSYRCS